jgi:CRP-like cAMP-binding protein
MGEPGWKARSHVLAQLLFETLESKDAMHEEVAQLRASVTDIIERLEPGGALTPRKQETQEITWANTPTPTHDVKRRRSSGLQDSDYALLRVGDLVQVTKKGSQIGKTGVVNYPDWMGRVKITMDDGGQIKSYKRDELTFPQGVERRASGLIGSPSKTASVTTVLDDLAFSDQLIKDMKHGKDLQRSGSVKNVMKTASIKAVKTSSIKVKRSAKNVLSLVDSAKNMVSPKRSYSRGKLSSADKSAENYAKVASNRRRRSSFAMDDLPSLEDVMMSWNLSSLGRAFHPECKPVLIWNVVMIVFIMHSILVIPFKLAFDQPAGGIELTSEVLFLLDLVLNFKIGYYAYGKLVMDLPEIRWHYLRTWFLIDLITAIPVEIAHLQSDMIILKVLRFLKIFRFFRLQALESLQRWYSINPAWIRLFKLVLSFCLVVHFMACIRHSWIGHLDVDMIGKGLTERYVLALYWTLLCVLGNDVIADEKYRNVIETHTFGIINLLVGIVVVSTIIGSASGLMVNMDTVANEKKTHLDGVRHYLNFRKVPKKLQMKIVDYYDFLWRSGQSQHYRELISDLPPTLAIQLDVILKDKLISNSKSKASRLIGSMKKSSDLSSDRQSWTHGISSKALLALLQTMAQQICVPNEILCKQGQSADRVYFLQFGKVKVLLERAGSVVEISEMSDGYFGELGLLTRSGLRTASVLTASHCNVQVVMQEDFERLMHDYPDLERTMVFHGKERLASTHGGEFANSALTPGVRGSPLAAVTRGIFREDGGGEDGFQGGEVGVEAGEASGIGRVFSPGGDQTLKTRAKWQGAAAIIKAQRELVGKKQWTKPPKEKPPSGVKDDSKGGDGGGGGGDGGGGGGGGGSGGADIKAASRIPLVDKRPSSLLKSVMDMGPSMRRLNTSVKTGRHLHRTTSTHHLDRTTSAVPLPPSHTYYKPKKPFHSLSPLTTHSLLINNKQTTNTHKHTQLCENNSTHAHLQRAY